MTQENQSRKFLEVLSLDECSADSFYLVKDKEGFDMACRETHLEGPDRVAGTLPVTYPSLVRLTLNKSYLSEVVTDCEVIDAPSFVSMYMGNPQLFEAGRKLTISEFFEFTKPVVTNVNKTYQYVWEAIEGNAEDVKKMSALSEATIWVMDYHYRTALNDVSDGVMKKVLIGKVSQLSMKDLYRVMWLNKLHTKELDEICTKYEQSIPKKEHYQ